MEEEEHQRSEAKAVLAHAVETDARLKEKLEKFQSVFRKNVKRTNSLSKFIDHANSEQTKALFCVHDDTIYAAILGTFEELQDEVVAHSKAKQSFFGSTFKQTREVCQSRWSVGTRKLDDLHSSPSL